MTATASLKGSPIISDYLADVNSPFALADADLATDHPLTIPSQAIGLIITVADAAAGVAELTRFPTKSTGIFLTTGQYTLRFHSLIEPNIWFLNKAGTGGGNTEGVAVVYLVH